MGKTKLSFRSLLSLKIPNQKLDEMLNIEK